MKQFCIILLFLSKFLTIYAQNPVDTIVIVSKKFKSLDKQVPLIHIKYKNDTFYLFDINGSREYCDSFFEALNWSPYLINIHYKSKSKIEEGFRNSETFLSDYKNYYKNGMIKTAGSFYKEYGKELTIEGQKVGVWKYYYRNGKIKKIILYHINIGTIKITYKKKNKLLLNLLEKNFNYGNPPKYW